MPGSVLIVDEWISIHHGVAENHLIDALAGLAFLAGGIIALDRRPGNASARTVVLERCRPALAAWVDTDGKPASLTCGNGRPGERAVTIIQRDGAVARCPDPRPSSRH